MTDWLRLLTAVSRQPAPDRNMLGGYLTIRVGLDVLAALFRISEPELWAALVDAGRRLFPALTPDLAVLLPAPLHDALAAGAAA
jgi:hypothetical protein